MDTRPALQDLRDLADRFAADRHDRQRRNDLGRHGLHRPWVLAADERTQGGVGANLRELREPLNLLVSAFTIGARIKASDKGLLDSP